MLIELDEAFYGEFSDRLLLIVAAHVHQLVSNRIGSLNVKIFRGMKYIGQTGMLHHKMPVGTIDSC